MYRLALPSRDEQPKCFIRPGFKALPGMQNGRAFLEYNSIWEARERWEICNTHLAPSRSLSVTGMETFLKSCLERKGAIWLKFHYAFFSPFGPHCIIEDVLKMETEASFMERRRRSRQTAEEQPKPVALSRANALCSFWESLLSGVFIQINCQSSFQHISYLSCSVLGGILDCLLFNK